MNDTHLQDPHEDATIRRVLRLVGPRPEVPAEATAAARAAAEVEWRRTVRAHSRWQRVRRPGVWLAAAMALLAVGLVYRGGLSPRDVARFEVVADSVSVEPRQATGPVRPGEAVRSGALIDTDGGRTALALAGGVSMRLDAGTRVRLRSESVLELLRGAVYVDSAGGSSVEVRTSLGVVRDVGTQFEVRLLDGGEATLRVRVREGAVTLEQDGQVHEGRAGAELRVAAGGEVTRGTVAAFDDGWDWVLATAPTFQAEGRTLGEFLDWLCREGGWTLRYANRDIAALAASATLSGDTEGLTPLQAAQLWLSASGLEHQLEDGNFLVDAKSPDREGGAP